MGDRGHNRHGPKSGGCYAPFAEAGIPSNTMWPGPRPTSMPSAILIHPAVKAVYATGGKLAIVSSLSVTLFPLGRVRSNTKLKVNSGWCFLLSHQFCTNCDALLFELCLAFLWSFGDVSSIRGQLRKPQTTQVTSYTSDHQKGLVRTF